MRAMSGLSRPLCSHDQYTGSRAVRATMRAMRQRAPDELLDRDVAAGLIAPTLAEVCNDAP